MSNSAMLFNQNRLVKFKRNRKAFSCAVLLSVCWCLSMFAELLCNDRPLLKWSGGKISVPFLQDPLLHEEEDLPSPTDLSSWDLWAPIRYSAQSVDLEIQSWVPSPPDSHHLLGTDDKAHDLLARLIVAFRNSLFFGLALAFLSGFLGTIVGTFQVYYGHVPDRFIQNITDILNSIPELFLFILWSSIFHPSFGGLLFLMLLKTWIPFASYTRAEYLRIRQLDFIHSAIQLGASPVHVLLHHIIPNTFIPTLTKLPLRASSYIINLASLDFLGLGLSKTTPSLGELLYQGKNNLGSWWILLSTLLVLTFIFLSLNTISNGIREALDPRL